MWFRMVVVSACLVAGACQGWGPAVSTRRPGKCVQGPVPLRRRQRPVHGGHRRWPGGRRPYGLHGGARGGSSAHVDGRDDHLLARGALSRRKAVGAAVHDGGRAWLVPFPSPRACGRNDEGWGSDRGRYPAYGREGYASRRATSRLRASAACGTRTARRATSLRRPPAGPLGARRRARVEGWSTKAAKVVATEPTRTRARDTRGFGMERHRKSARITASHPAVARGPRRLAVEGGPPLVLDS